MDMLKFVKSIVEQGGYVLPKRLVDYYKDAYNPSSVSDFDITERGAFIGRVSFAFIDRPYVMFNFHLIYNVSYSSTEEARNFFAGEPTLFNAHINGASVYTNYMLVKEKYLDFIALGKKYYNIDYPDTPEAKLAMLHRRGGRPFDKKLQAVYKKRKKEAVAIVEDFMKSFYKRYPYMVEYDRRWSKMSGSDRFHYLMRDTALLNEMGIKFNDGEKYSINMFSRITK